MNRFIAVMIILGCLAGCSGKPSHREIERLFMAQHNSQDSLFKDVIYIKNFKVNDGFQKEKTVYIADSSYHIIFKLNIDDAANLLAGKIGQETQKAAKDVYGIDTPKKDGGFGGRLLDGIFTFSSRAGLAQTYGTFKAGDIRLNTCKITLIKKESGWAIDSIEDVSIERVVTPEQKEKEKREEALRKQKEEREAAERRQTEAREAEERKRREEREAALLKQKAELEEARRRAEAEAKALDEKEWANAQQIGTDEAYRAYLSQPNHDLHGEEARHRLAVSAYERAQKSGTPEAYKQFLAEFPSSKPAMEAKSALEQLLWVDANVVKTLDSYREFLSLFPTGKYSEQAGIQVDEMSWDEARRNGNEEAIAKYLASFPRGRHSGDAREAQDALAWSNAAKENGASGYLSYASRFPRGKHIQDCRRAAIVATLRAAGSQLKTVDIIGRTPWSGIRVVDITPDVISTLVQLGYKEPITGGVVIYDILQGYHCCPVNLP